MKPWEETWERMGSLVVTEEGVTVSDALTVTHSASFSDDAHAALASAAPDMARILLEVALAFRGRLPPATESAIDAALRKAGVLEVA